MPFDRDRETQESDRPKDDIQHDIGDALRYLDTIVVDKNKENTYLYRYYVRANIFVFANTIQLELLAKQGNIFLMDSTHDLNHWKWYFFTIYIRDKSGQWFPVVIFLLQNRVLSLI